MAKTTHIDQVRRIWKATFKKVTGFPRNTPDDVILRFTDSPDDWMQYFASTTEIKCKQRFEKYDQKICDQTKKPCKTDKKIVKAMPSNLPKIYSLASHLCPTHRVRLEHQHFCKHIGEKYDELIVNLFASCPKHLNHDDVNQRIKDEYDSLIKEIKDQKIMTKEKKNH